MAARLDAHDARILVVDDQASNVRLLELALRRGNYTDVSSTTDPRQVTALHLENRFDLIMLDLQMPMMDGFEVMKGIRALDGSAEVAILVMSADPAQMVASLEGGANSFLSKPVVLGEVLARVGTMLTHKAATPDAPAASGTLPEHSSDIRRPGFRPDE